MVEKLTDGTKSIEEWAKTWFSEGVQSFSLLNDGTATFGKSGQGQIKFNGNNGTIESGN